MLSATKKLWKLLIDRNMKEKRLIQAAGISMLNSLGKENVTRMFVK